MKDVTLGSGNVFADLGLPNPELRQAKADLAIAISKRIQALGLTQAAAATLMGLDQPKVSALVRGRLSGFSLERLAECLSALQCDVVISYRPVITAGSVRVQGCARHKVKVCRRKVLATG